MNSDIIESLKVPHSSAATPTPNPNNNLQFSVCDFIDHYITSDNIIDDVNYINNTLISYQSYLTTQTQQLQQQQQIQQPNASIDTIQQYIEQLNQLYSKQHELLLQIDQCNNNTEYNNMVELMIKADHELSGVRNIEYYIKLVLYSDTLCNGILQTIQLCTGSNSIRIDDQCKLQAACEQYIEVLIILQHIQQYPQLELTIQLQQRCTYICHTIKPMVLDVYNGTLISINYPQQANQKLLIHTKAITPLVVWTTILLRIQDLLRITQLIQFSGTNELWVIDRMLQLITRRFIYHFDSDQRSTNRLDKPEWMLTYIQSAVVDHIGLLYDVIQPLVDEYYTSHKINTVGLFYQTLIHLVNNKLTRNIRLVMKQPNQLRHTIDQIILYQGKLQQIYYGDTRLIDVLTSNDVLPIWLSIDQRYTYNRLNLLKRITHPWLPISNSGNTLNNNLYDDLDNDSNNTIDRSTTLATHTAHEFDVLLDQMIDRFKYISKLSQRLLFINEIIYPLLNDYSIYLTDSCNNLQNDIEPIISTINADTEKLHSVWQQISGCVNTVQYTYNLLSNISEQTDFIELSYYYNHQYSLGDDATSNTVAQQLNKNFDDIDDDKSIFDTQLDLLNALQKSSIDNIVNAVSTTFQQSARAWRKLNRWIVHNNDINVPTINNDSSTVQLSAVFIQPLSQLDKQLRYTHQYMSDHLFDQFILSLTSNIATWIYMRVIMTKYYNRQRVIQLQCDINSLYNVFNRYTKSYIIQRQFISVNESLTVLSLSSAQRIELDNALDNDELMDDVQQYNVYKLDVYEVRDLLARRHDQLNDATQQIDIHNESNTNSDSELVHHTDNVPNNAEISDGIKSDNTINSNAPSSIQHKNNIDSAGLTNDISSPHINSDHSKQNYDWSRQ